jgi:teichuronic acid biosynthesis glycosyltransferase TuaC
MHVLIVCSGNAPNFRFELHQAFVYDQAKAIQQADATIRFSYFFIQGQGIRGYLRNLQHLHTTIRDKKPNLIHAHVGLAALLANMQRKVPVITTFHGSDINLKSSRILSGIANILSRKSIFVSKQLRDKAWCIWRSEIIPCGVDMDVFKPMNKEACREKLNLSPTAKYLLFSSSFTNPVKNYQLLQEAMKHLHDMRISVIELSGYARQEVAELINAVDLCIITSHMEGSPQFLKEAMACNCPLVSTDVGDVKELLGNEPGYALVDSDPVALAKAIRALLRAGKTNGRSRLAKYNNAYIASRIIAVYKD